MSVYNVENYKREIIYFLSKNPNNLKLLQIYFDYLNTDEKVLQEEMQSLDLEYVQYFKKDTRNIIKNKQHKK